MFSWIQNISWTLLSNVLGKALAFALIIISARILAPEEFGLFSFLIALVFVFVAFTDLGIWPVTVRDMAKKKDLTNNYFGDSLVLRVILIGIAWILVPLLALSSSLSPAGWIALILLLASLSADTLVLCYSAVLFGHERTDLPAIQNFLKCLICFVLGTVLLVSGFGIVGLAVAYATGSVASLLYLAVRSRRILPQLRAEITRRGMELLAKSALPFAVIYGLDILYARIDVIMVALISGDYEAGLYSVVYRINEALVFLAHAVTKPVIATVTRYVHDGRDESITVIHRALIVVLSACVLPLTLAAWSAPEAIITLLYGSDYASAAPIFRILATALFLTFIIFSFNIMVIAHHDQKKISFLLTASIVLNVILNALWIPHWGASGAAAALICSEFFAFIAYLIITRRYTHRLRILTVFWPLILPVGLYVIGWHSSFVIGPLARLFLAEGLYGAGLLVLLFRSRKELKSLLSNN